MSEATDEPSSKKPKTMVTKETLLKVQDAVDALIKENNCGPILVRLAWHDAGTFDKDVKDPWPAAGGATGSIRFAPELAHGANSGLDIGITLLKPIKDKYPDVSYADLLQMASARAIALAGGPKIDMKYGRVDVEAATDCVKEGNLPDGNAGPEGKYGSAGGTASTEDTTPQGHLRKVFHRMGCTDEDIVALSGAHTIGRAYKGRSGEGAEKTKFTCPFAADGAMCRQKLVDGTEVECKAGGSSWTENFLVFDNSYYKLAGDKSRDPELLMLSTDLVLFEDDKFKVFAEKFRDDQDAFFASYAKAHKKLSELGSKFDPPEGISL